MKKLIYILSIIYAVASCMPAELEVPEGGRQIVDGMLLVDFSIENIPFGNRTKAFGMDPSIRSLKVIVFDNHGVYMSQSDATLTNLSTQNNVTTGYYSAHFPVSDKDETRIIHFIANYSGDITYGTELEVISKIIVENGTDCYWQRIVVDNLMAEEQNGTMVLKKQAQLQNIVLIRNFCAFTVSTTPGTSHLDIQSAAIYNVPDKGTVAPYSADNSSFVGGNGFVTKYQEYANPTGLITAGYKAAVPLEYGLTKYESGSVFTGIDATNTISLFSYEREVPLNDPPFILVSGKWGTTESARSSAPTTYYKINLRDIDDNYFPLLRNFDYKINILEVKRAGATSVEEALKSAGSGDISTDIRFGNLTEISNGEAQIKVTTTDMVLVDNSPVQIKYKFIPDVSSDTPSNDSAVSITLGDAGLTGAVFSSMSDIVKAGADDAEGWRTITLTPNSPGDSPRKQSVTITGTYTLDGKNYKISRTVNFTLRQKPQFTLQVLDNSGSQTNVISGIKETPFTLRIGIPGGLPSSMFPLELAIEAKERTITPNTGVSNNNLPVVTGKSVFDANKPGFHYVKTLQYSEYAAASLDGDGYKHFDAYFKTNIAASATDIIVSNPYFNTAATYFTNGGAKTFNFDMLEIRRTNASSVLSLSFFMQQVEPVTIRLNNGLTLDTTDPNVQMVNSGEYRFTPTAAGTQEIGINLNGSKFTTVTLLAANYNNASCSFGVVITFNQVISNNVTNKYVYDNNGTLALSSSGTTVSDVHKWKVVDADNDNGYKLQNVQTGRYIKTTNNTQENPPMTSDINEASYVHFIVTSGYHIIQVGENTGNNGRYFNNWNGISDNNQRFGFYTKQDNQLYLVDEI